jgi:hypothetical protein
MIEFVVGSKKPTQQSGGKRGLVRTKIFGKSKTYKQAFIAPRRKGDSKTAVYVRKSKARSPIRMMFGPGIEALFKARGNDEIMQKTVRDRFSTEFARNLAFYVNRMRKG